MVPAEKDKKLMGNLPPRVPSVQAPAFRSSLAAREAEALGFLQGLDLLPDRAVPAGASLYLVGAQAVRRGEQGSTLWQHYAVRVDGSHRENTLPRLARWLVSEPNRYLAVRLFAFRTERTELSFWGSKDAARKYGEGSGVGRVGARAVGVPLYGFDIDFQGGGHTELAFGTREGLLEWIRSKAVPLLAPWCVVDTGGGFQVFLRPRRASAMRERLAALAELDEEHKARHEAALEAEDYAVRLEAYKRLDALLNASAHEAGGGVDMVADCGRVLRIPGGWREKSSGRNGPVLQILAEELAAARAGADLDAVEGLRLTGEHGRLWALARELAQNPPPGWDAKQARVPFLGKRATSKSERTRRRAQDPRAYRLEATASPAVSRAFEALGWAPQGRVRCPVCQGGARAGHSDTAIPFADGGLYCHRSSCGFHAFERWVALALPDKADELVLEHRGGLSGRGDYSAAAVPVPWGELGVEILERLGVRGAGALVEEPVRDIAAKLWRFERCPLCELEGCARMLGSGHLECSSRACRAFSLSSRGGSALRDWARLAGLERLGELEAIARAAVRQAEEDFAAKAEGRALYSPHAPRLNRNAQDGPEVWREQVAKEARQRARRAILESRFSPAVLVIPTGAGKSTILGEEMAASGDSFVLAVPSHKLAAERIEHLRSLEVSVDTLEGVASACEFREEFAALGSPFEWWKAQRCPSCPLRDTCRAMRKPDLEARVLVVTHERLFASVIPGPFGYTLSDELGHGRRVVVDEMPDPVALEEISEADYRRAEASAPAFERKLQGAMAWVLPVIRRGLERARTAAISRSTPEALAHGVRVEGAELREALAAEYGAAKDGGAAFLRELALFAQVPRGSGGLAEGHGTPHPLEVSEEARLKGAAFNLAGPRWLSTFHGFLAGGSGAPSSLELLVQRGEAGAIRWRLEARRVRHLPSARVLLLDATANLTRPMLSAAFGREPTFHELDIERDSAHLRVWLQTNEASRGALGGSGADASRKTLSGAGLELVRRWIAEAIALPEIEEHLAAIQGRRVRLGILSFLLVADDLRRRFELDPESLVEHLGLDPARYELDGERIGHYGRDEVGTNRFRGGDLLLVIGDGCPNLGAAEATARAYAAAGHAVTAEEVVEAARLSKLAQGVGRSRDQFDRDGSKVATVAVGRTIPPGWRAGDFVTRLRRKGAKAKEGDARALVLALWERDGRFPLAERALAELAAGLAAYAADGAAKAATPSGGSRMRFGEVLPAYLSDIRVGGSGMRAKPPSLPSRASLASAARALARELEASGQGEEAVEEAGLKGGRPRAVFRRVAAVLPFRDPRRAEALRAAQELLLPPFVERHERHAEAVWALLHGLPRALPPHERARWRRLEREARELLARAQARAQEAESPTVPAVTMATA